MVVGIENQDNPIFVTLVLTDLCVSKTNATLGELACFGGAVLPSWLSRLKETEDQGALKHG